MTLLGSFVLGMLVGAVLFLAGVGIGFGAAMRAIKHHVNNFKGVY